MLSNSTFGQAFEAGKLSIPNPCRLPGTDHDDPDLPYIIVGDEAFPLKNNMFRPYAGRYLPGIHNVFPV